MQSPDYRPARSRKAQKAIGDVLRLGYYFARGVTASKEWGSRKVSNSLLLWNILRLLVF